VGPIQNRRTNGIDLAINVISYNYHGLPTLKIKLTQKEASYPEA